VQYAFKSTASDDEWTEMQKDKDESKKYQDEIKALTAKLKEYTTAYTSR
jgi:cytochrome c556